MSPDFPPGFTPDFADPALQSDAPQVNIIIFLSCLSDTWKPISPATDGDDMAVGVLLLADGIQIREAASGPEARLTVSGIRWKNVLLANRGMPTESKARQAVLTFVWDQYQERTATPPQTAPPEALADSEAPEGENKPPEALAELPDLVTLDQAAAAAHTSKRTLERHKTEGTLPDPVREGGGGRAALYDWKVMRPWLTENFGIILPERFPANFR